jgi:RNA polymerase sigma factor (sigma-70 family)
MFTSEPDFESLILPWLDAGFNLARWLLKDEAAAEDVLQESALRALRYLDRLDGDNARAWLLKIVRNACYTHLEQQKSALVMTGFDDEALESLHWQADQCAPDPSTLMDQRQCAQHINDALRMLSPGLREVVVLRELEGLDYAEIAHIASLPVGTVMSRLSRARTRLRELLQAKEGRHRYANE